MPTGPKHQRWMSLGRDEGGDETGYQEDCRCMIGSDHDDGDEDDGEMISVYDAANIWLSNGMDEDYTFGYSDSELRSALGSD